MKMPIDPAREKMLLSRRHEAERLALGFGRALNDAYATTLLAACIFFAVMLALIGD